MERYIHLPTAQDIWKALSKAFYDGADELQVFTLNQRAFSAKQNARPLSIYYGELIEIFSELDHCDKVVMVDETDIASYQKLLQRQRVHIFLAGLEGDFEQVRGEILRKDPIHSETSAVVTRNLSNQNWSPQHQQDQKRPIHPKNANGGDKSSYKCTHCDQTGHTKVDAMNLWDIRNGEIIAVIPGRRIPRRPLLLQLLKQRQMMIAVKSPRHWQQQQVMVVRF